MLSRKLALVPVAGALALALPSLALRSLAQDGDKKEEGCHVAKSGGGTFPLPVDDEKKMAELQGLSGDGPKPKLAITFPAEDQVLEEKQDGLTVKYKLDDYAVGKDAAGGQQHVHVILDDQDYKADYSKDGSTTFTEKDGLRTGTHVLTIFPARAYHLSIKSPGACSQVRFHWGKKGGEVAPKDAPQLIYSRPKGEYKGDEAKRILCDFYLLNVDLAKLKDGKIKILATVEGQTPMGTVTERHILTEWKPFIILKDAQPGDYDVRLELNDWMGKPIGGAWNQRSHSIKVLGG